MWVTLSVKAFSVVVLLCPFTSAVDRCGAGSCLPEHDSTSLVQVKQIVKPGSERSPAEDADSESNAELAESSEQEADFELQGDEDKWPPTWATPVHDDRAIVSSMPNGIDEGDVTSAYERNIDKVSKPIETEASEEIAFMKKVREQRKFNKAAAEAEVALTKKAVKAAEAADERAEKATAAERHKTVQEAIARVDEAKEDWEAHRIKKRQAEKAALEGRLEGEFIGDRQAHRRQEDFQSELEAEKKQAIREQERMALEKQKMARRAAINAQTKKLHDEEVAWEKKAAATARAATARASARAHEAEDRLEGAEGMKNRLLTDASNHIVNHYERLAEKEQERTNDAAAAAWPAGFQPAGP